MFEALIVSSLAVAVFASTNLDNLFLLLGFLAQPNASTKGVRLAYLSVTVAVLLASLAAARGVGVIPAALTSYLGLVPIGFGLWGVIQLLRTHDGQAAAISPGSGIASLAMLTAIHSGDSLAVFTALLAETRETFHLLVIAAAVACALAWVGLASWLVDHEQLGSRVRRAAPYLLPPLLILVGVYILFDTPTDVEL